MKNLFSMVNIDELKTLGYTDEEIKKMINSEETRVAIDNFSKQFMEIYSFKDSQIGKKRCRNCRYYKDRLSDYEGALKKTHPSPLGDVEYSVCKMATNMAIKAIENEAEREPIYTLENGYCTLFKMSILRIIKRFFFSLFSVCPGDEDCHSKIRCRGCEK